MHIQHKEGRHHNRFYMEQDDQTVAELVYATQDPGVMVIEHTEVDKALQGKNIGYELVHHTVEYARTNGLKVSPVCPFAKAVFDKKPEFADVLA